MGGSGLGKVSARARPARRPPFWAKSVFERFGRFARVGLRLTFRFRRVWRLRLALGFGPSGRRAAGWPESRFLCFAAGGAR